MQDDLIRFGTKMHGVFNDPQKIEQEWGVGVLDSMQLTCLRAVLCKYRLSSFGREKMKSLKLSQKNGLYK